MLPHPHWDDDFNVTSSLLPPGPAVLLLTEQNWLSQTQQTLNYCIYVVMPTLISFI